ncbi:MAG TPA: HNH endonuclease [Anaerolineae bacterium]|nr:HNH endonuclease [Anaerolineae bacterium]
MYADVLVLNASYEPLHLVSIRRAVLLLLKEKAELIEATDQMIRAASAELPRPLVIRLRRYIKLPRNLAFPLTRRLVYARDQYTCQYCGGHFSASQLTMDHVIPKSRGGQKTWENIVTACKRCNQKKGNRTPDEAHMHLIRPPYRPRYVALVWLKAPDQRHPAWEKYLTGNF